MTNGHTLADGHLPLRVRGALAALLAQTETELTPRVEQTLAAFEQQLLGMAERARNPAEQDDLLKSLQALARRRQAFPRHYLKHVESRLAGMRRHQARKPDPARGALTSSLEWALNTKEATEETWDRRLRELSGPMESGASLALYLLGQRFGVLAAEPAFALDRLPVGPRQLLAAAGDTCAELFGERFPQTEFLPLFAERVLADYARYVDDINTVLESAGVLPGLSFVPVRPPRAKHRPAASAGTAPGPSANDDAAHETPVQSPSPSPSSPTGQPQDFRFLQQLLSARRIASRQAPAPPPASGGEIAHHDLAPLLEDLQTEATGLPDNQLRSITGLRDALLRRARRIHGEHATLNREDNDTFEILALLYAEVIREVRTGSTVISLLQRLQLPLVRLALDDRGFFENPEHPARQLINNIAEYDAVAYGKHSADSQYEAAMQRAVKRIENEYHEAGETLVAEVNQGLQEQLRQQARRLQANEKRLIEAARGRERLAMAKNLAAEALDARLRAATPPRAIEMLMRNAWLDALTLSLLRSGQPSPAWRAQLEVTDRILDIVNDDAPRESPELARAIEQTMRQIGYHEHEAGSVARQLSRSQGWKQREDEPSATEIAARIKTHARFGGETAEERKSADSPPRTPREEECYRHLRTLPFGCWMDFMLSQRGDYERRRLSWYSTITDHALFVNRHGQRVAEMHMDTLARMMARDQLRIVAKQELRLVDRALRSTIELLQTVLRGGVSATPVYGAAS
ncbi:DUF1631 family protein [Solilutibacter pythonis]|nr:DUF1631 family protein [Lysobacter pythonis]